MEQITDQASIWTERVDPQSEESPLLTDGDREFLSGLTAPSRRAQWATARKLLRHALGADAELRYASSGALILAKPVGEVRFVSISHTSEQVAVMLSRSRCGVDIEQIDRHFSKVASRYITHEEREQFEVLVGEQFEALLWSAKEALYKYGAHEGLDFLQDMIVTAIDPTSQTLSAELYGLATSPVHYRLVDNHILCYVSADN